MYDYKYNCMVTGSTEQFPHATFFIDSM